MAVLPYKPLNPFNQMKAGGGTASREGILDPNQFTDEELAAQKNSLERKRNTFGLFGPEAENYANLKAVLDERNQQRTGIAPPPTPQAQIKDIFNQTGGTPGGTTTAGTGVSSIMDLVKQTADNQRRGVSDAFTNALKLGTQAINEQSAQQRGQAIDEEGALGSRLGSAISRSTESPIGRADIEKSRALTNLVNSLAGQYAQGNVGVERDIAGNLLQGIGLGNQATSITNTRATNIADLINRANEFEKNYGLESAKSSYGQAEDVANRRLQQEQLDLSSVLGREQAEAQKPSLFGQIIQGLGGLGNLFGGVGSLVGGFGASGALSKILARLGGSSAYGGSPAYVNA